MKITFRRGSKTTTVDAGDLTKASRNTRLTEAIAAEQNDPLFAVLQAARRTASPNVNIMTEFLHQIADRDVEAKAKKAEKIVIDTADVLMGNFYAWVGSNFMTGSQSLIVQDVLSEAHVSWKPLSREYLSEKERLGLASGYWHFTGKLYRQFRSANSRRRWMFGHAKVSHTARGNTAMITINVAPELGELTGRGLEQRLMDLGFGGNAEMVRKLQGRLDYYRPLLGPAINYYIRHVVASAVRAKLVAAGIRLKRLSNSGSAAASDHSGASNG